MKKEIEHFTFIGPAAWCSFSPESQSSSLHYRELHNQAQALMEAKKHENENQVFQTYRASELV
jgi:hypothetical protein